MLHVHGIMLLNLLLQIADILPKDNESDNESEIDMDFCAETQVLLIHMNELEEVQDLIDKLYLENPLTADEFIQCDGSELTTEMISNEEILKAILPNNQETKVEETDSSPLSSITHNETIETIEHYDKYLEQQENKFDITKMKQRFISAEQMNLDNFINIA